MNEIGNHTQYAVIVKTDSYAGNFEREMTAYITGEIGECEVGSKLLPLFVKDLGKNVSPFLDAIDHVPDEHGCHRPCIIYNDNDEYNSFAIFFSFVPAIDQLDLIIERANMYCTDKRLKAISRFISRPKKILRVFPIKIETRVSECNPRIKPYSQS